MRYLVFDKHVEECTWVPWLERLVFEKRKERGAVLMTSSLAHMLPEYGCRYYHYPLVQAEIDYSKARPCPHNLKFL